MQRFEKSGVVWEQIQDKPSFLGIWVYPEGSVLKDKPIGAYLFI